MLNARRYNESQGDLFNEVECEAAKEEEVEITTVTTTKKHGKRKLLPKGLSREVIELDLDDHEKQCACWQHHLWQISICNATVSLRVPFTQSDIELSQTMMTGWVIQVSEKFALLYVVLKEHLLQQVVVQANETLLNVLKKDKQCYMWLYYSGADSPDATIPSMKNIALYGQNSRSRTCSVAFLGDYSGYLQTNGYGVYDGLNQVTNVGCLA